MVGKLQPLQHRAEEGRIEIQEKEIRGGRNRTLTSRTRTGHDGSVFVDSCIKAESRDWKTSVSSYNPSGGRRVSLGVPTHFTLFPSYLDLDSVSVLFSLLSDYYWLRKRIGTGWGGGVDG